MSAWLLLLAGAGVWAVLLAVVTFGKTPPGCPNCHHESGLDGKHCADTGSYSGWGNDQCLCGDDYHWNVREPAVP